MTMKKFLNIVTICLLAALSATAQTHRLRIRTMPDKVFHVTIQCYGPEAQLSNNGYFYGGEDLYYINNDTMAIDLQLPVGAAIEMWVNPYSGKTEDYKLVNWKDGGAITTVASNGNGAYLMRMPDRDVDLVGTFGYDPSSPNEYEQPSIGSWNPTTATLILDSEDEDHFPLGFTYEDCSKVKYLIRAGNYYNVYPVYFSAYNYTNCLRWDVSRTNAKEAISSSGWDDVTCKLTEVVLPSTIKKLSAGAFQKCDLHTLFIYALTPPEIGDEYTNWETHEMEWHTPFPDCQNMEVRVPAEAVPLYQAAEHWKDFTILAIDGTYANLTVKLMPQLNNNKLAKYKDMSLVLTSKVSGETKRFIVGKDNAYEFRYLATNSTYKVQLLNDRDVEVAVIDNIYLGDENKTVVFDRLRDIHKMSLSLKADGKFVDGTLYEVTWLNADGYYIRKGPELEGMIDDEQLGFSVQLDRSLAMKYQQPDTTRIFVGMLGQSDEIVYELKPIGNTAVTFNVVDSVTHRGIDQAVIQVSQLLDFGQTGNTVTLTTGSDGKATGEALAALSHIIVTSPIHGSQEFTANLADSTAFRTVFMPANGTSITLNHTYQAAVPDNEEPTVEQGYQDGRSLEYEFHALLPNGQDSLISHYLSSYPTYTLYQTLPAGSKVRVVATDTRGQVEPTEAESDVTESGTVGVTLPIVQRGYIEVVYKKSESTHPAVIILDAETGELVKKQPFGNFMTTQLSNLNAGRYLVVGMSKGLQYQSVTSKAQLELFEKDKDYVIEEVTVSEGHVANVEFFKIPLAMTKLETHLSVQNVAWEDAAPMVGMQATMGIEVAIDGVKRNPDPSVILNNAPTDCKLEVYVPDGLEILGAYRYCWLWNVASFGAMYSDTGVLSYTTDEVRKHGGAIAFYNPAATQIVVSARCLWYKSERKMVIEWPHIEEIGKMKLFLTPTLAGTFYPEIYLVYTLNGKEYREILETTSITAAKANINVPELVIRPTFKVSGKAMYYDEDEIKNPETNAGRKKSAGTHIPAGYFKKIEPPKYVTVMDGNQPIGKAEIKSDGKWETYVTLTSARPLSKHHIYAKIEYPTRVKYQTETHELTYDPNGVVPLWTKMSFFNHHPLELKNVEVYFDYEQGEAYPHSYGFDNRDGMNTDFTFEVNLSNNDPAKVYACAVFINTEGPDAEERVVMAHYNKRKNRWIAYSKFNTRSLPYSVVVEPYYHSDLIGSRDNVEEAITESIENVFKKSTDGADLEVSLDQVMAQVKKAIDADDMSLAPSWDVIQRVTDQLFSYDGLDDVPASARGANSAELEDYEAKLKELNEQTAALRALFTDEGLNINTLGTIAEGFSATTADGLTEAQLSAEGYEKIYLDDASIVYLLAEEGKDWVYVDLKRNLKMVAKAEAIAAARAADDGTPSWFKRAGTISNLIDKYNTTLGYLSDGLGAAIDFFQNICNEYLKTMKQQQALMKSLEASTEKWSYVKWWDTAIAYKATRASMASFSRIKDWLTKFKVGTGICTLSTLFNIGKNYVKFVQQTGELITIYLSIPKECPDDQADCDEIRSTLNTFAFLATGYYIATIGSDIGSVGLTIASIAGLVESGGLSFIGVGLSIAKIILSMKLDDKFDKQYEENVNDVRYAIRQLECDKKKTCQLRGDCPKCVSAGTCPEWPKVPKEPKYPTTKPTLDPSGFVYEGVEDNRLEGVTATVFYKEVKKDVFGDDVENVYMWDAENYSQVNPQTTDVNGEYGWMVPAGLWQVKYEKQGYQTEYSEWLPVPPPQLDVNQAMKQLGEPNVSSVKATQRAVTIGFDKYMYVDSLTSKTLFVTHNGNVLSGTIDPMLPADEIQALSRISNKVCFVPETSLPVGQTLTLTVKAGVTSYAGTPMSSDFQQNFEIEAFVEKLEADSAVHIIYDQSEAVTIQAVPAAAAANKKANVKVISDMIVSADTQEITFDAQGKATFTLTGEAYGTTAVVVQLQDDADIKSTIMVDVKEGEDFICPMPTANYLPSQAYPSGTQIILLCELPEAVVYYTLDGTCPCNPENDVHVYDAPIILDKDIVIKAIAMAPGYADSEISEFTFLLDDGTGIREVKEPVQRPTNSMYTLSGVKVVYNSHLPKGIYIRGGKKHVVK